MKVFSLTSLVLVACILNVSAFMPTTNRPLSIKARPTTQRQGVFGPSEKELEKDRIEMQGMSEQEKSNYLSWKETNKETDSMTFVSVLSIIPFSYFLWVALFADNAADV